MDSARDPPNDSEEEIRDSDSPEGGASSGLLSLTESALSRLGSETEAAEPSVEIAIEEVALEAREEPAATEAEGEEAEAPAETAEEQEEPEQTHEAEEPAQPLAEGEAEDAEAAGEEEEEEKVEKVIEREMAVEEKEKKEETEGEEEEAEEGQLEEEEEEKPAAAAYLMRREKSLTQRLSLRDVDDDTQAVTARKAMPVEEGADRVAPLAPVQKLHLDAELQDRAPEPPEEGAPWSQETQKEEEEQLRAELVQQYNSLMAERSRYQRYNFFLQHKISEALRRKKGQDAAVAEATDRVAEPESPEKEQAYLGYVAMLEDLRKQQADDLAWYHQELQQLKKQCRYTVEHAEKDWRKFQALKKQVVLQAMGSGRMTGGRQEVLRQVEQIQALEDKKEKEMSAVRLENVQLKQCLVHFDTRMRAQEDLTQGLHLIDFEQLKIENQTFNEKVEERNEELLKLRGKVGNNVQILTHVKEKLHFVDSQNLSKKAQLQETEAQVALRRDILTKTKQARDSLRLENIRLNQRCGLLGKRSLLRDLEDKVEKTELLTERLESLKQHHASLMLTCRGMKQKIREAKSFVPS